MAKYTDRFPYIYNKVNINTPITKTVLDGVPDNTITTGALPAGDYEIGVSFEANFNGNKDKPLVFDQLCHSCGGCMLVCPTGAIKEKPKEIGFSDFGTANGVKFGQGRLKIGDIHTPPLIKQVKKSSIDTGIVIIDVPPGTSCPVIEAIKGSDFVLLVTEPTPFGLNDLKLAVGMVRELKIPFAVVINRSEPDEQMTNQYCQDENIDIIFEVPDDRRIAEAYSVGKMIVDVLPDYKKVFVGLYENISKKLEG